MTDFRFMRRLFFAVCICGSYIGQCWGMMWRSEQTVDQYTQFASVTPFRFPLSPTAKQATWAFRATRMPSKCDHKNISVYLQYGSLPLVNPLSETFPPHFYLGRSHLTKQDVKTDNRSVTHTELLPLHGDWYALAFIPGHNDQIVQKGLTVHCHYKVSASLEVKELPAHVILPVNQLSQVALSSNLSDGTWVGFSVPGSAQALDVEVRNCSLDTCSIQMWTYSEDTGQVAANCSQVHNSTCVLHLPSPRLAATRYVSLRLMTEGNASVTVQVTTQDCLPSGGPSSPSMGCVLGRTLDRLQGRDDFSVDFVVLDNDTVQVNEVVLTNTTITVVTFTLQSVTDIGGTLSVGVTFSTEHLPADQQVRVCGLVTAGRFPSSADQQDLCVNATNGLQVNSSSAGGSGRVSRQVSAQLWVPYPEQGPWTVALTMQCFSTSNGSVAAIETCQNGTQPAKLSVQVQSCVGGGCSGQGACKEYIKSSDFIVFSTCQCSAGWRGYGCTDGRKAFSHSSQLIEVLLLTLSNLFFLPAILLALHRRYYIEAIIYFYNMFFSTFYHACDGDRVDKYIYCMTSYSVLAMGDFLASTVSLWVTLVAMAQMPLTLAAAVQMAGPLALIIGVLLDRTSLWVIAVPTGVGLTLVAVCWVVQCCWGKRCFPDKRRYVWMLPGVLFAVAGAVMFAFFETTSNYKYMHSAWHVCLSLAIIFLLPPRRKQKVTSSVNLDDTESTEGLVLGPNNYTRRLNFEL